MVETAASSQQSAATTLTDMELQQIIIDTLVESG